MKCRQVSWPDLPPELLLKIAECLETRLDIQHFREVCKTWERSIPLSLLTSKNILSPHFPHSLATCTRSWLDSTKPRSPVLVASSVFLIQSTLVPMLPPWLFTAEELHPGKLIVSERLSPIASRKLPDASVRSLDLSHIQVSELAAFHRLRFVDDPFDMFTMKKFPDFNDNRVVLFVDPKYSKTTLPTTSDCTAIVLHHKGSLRAIRLKDEQELDVSYKRTYLAVKKFDDVVNFKEKVYAIDRRGRAYSMDYDTLSLLLLVEKPSLDALSERKKRLAVSSDHQDLYLLDRCCRPGTRNGVRFNVYKLNERESKWDKVEGIGDDKILFVTFDGSFFASTQEFQRCKGNSIVFYRSCFTSKGVSPHCEYNDSLSVYNFKDDTCQYVTSTSYYRNVFWTPRTWLSANAGLSKRERETKKDEATQFDAKSHDDAKQTIEMNELEHAVSHLETLREENNITYPVSKRHITSTTQKYNSGSSTVKFKGLDIKSNLFQTLHNIWSMHGNLMEDIIISNGERVSRALESLASAVLILEQTSVRSLTDLQVDYLKTTLSYLQCMHFKVGWLVPYVEKAVQLHKSKSLIDSRVELLHHQAEVVERRSKLIEELAELNNLEDKSKTDVARLILLSGVIDLDQPVGCGFY